MNWKSTGVFKWRAKWIFPFVFQFSSQGWQFDCRLVLYTTNSVILVLTIRYHTDNPKSIYLININFILPIHIEGVEDIPPSGDLGLCDLGGSPLKLHGWYFPGLPLLLLIMNLSPKSDPYPNPHPFQSTWPPPHVNPSVWVKPIFQPGWKTHKWRMGSFFYSPTLTSNWHLLIFLFIFKKIYFILFFIYLFLSLKEF